MAAAKAALSMAVLPPPAVRPRSSSSRGATTTAVAAQPPHPAPSNPRRVRSVKSVRFTLEPVARDVQRSMEQELWRWLEASYSVVRPLAASARGQAQVMTRCGSPTSRPAAVPAMAAGAVRLVVKAVAVTLPPHRRRASSAATTATTECSEEEDRSWSRAQLAPDVALALWEQRRRQLRHIAGVVDVFTLASMVLHRRAAGTMTRERRSDGAGGDTFRLCSSFLGSSCGSTASGRVPMPVLNTSDLADLGWKLDTVEPPAAQPHSRTSQRGSRSRSPRRDPALLPHPTVFLYAREYVDQVEGLWSILQDRWGRERLPVTVMPTWVNVAAVYSDPTAVAGPAADAGELSAEALEKLSRHLERWLKGSSAVDRVKRRASERVAAQAAQATEGDKTALTAHDAADVAWGVCSALARLHRAGLTHGNLKPNNVLVGAGPAPGAVDASSEAAAQSTRTVHVTDHLLPLFPDRLVEPGAVLRVPVPTAADGTTPQVGATASEAGRRVARHGFVCLKLHKEATAAEPAVSASTLEYLFGGGPPPPSTADGARPTLSLSGCYAIEAADVGAESPPDAGGGCVFTGGVETLVQAVPYEAVLLLHLAAPERVLIAPAPPEKSATPTPRVWVDTQHPATAADIYALGVLLYTMLVGRLPPLPRFRRASLGEGGRGSAGICGTRPTPAYMSVVRSIVHKLYAGAAQGFKHDPAPMLEELAVLLESPAASAHVPLVLALARAGVRPVTMQVLIGMLHNDPAERLSLAQLQEHAFFRAYGRRRHHFRAMLRAEPPAASPLRHSAAAALQRRFMPRNMGATAASSAAASVVAPTAAQDRAEQLFHGHATRAVYGAVSTRRASDAADLTEAASADAEPKAAPRRRVAYAAAADFAGGERSVRAVADPRQSRAASVTSDSSEGDEARVRASHRQRWVERRASEPRSPSPEPHLTRAPPAVYIAAPPHRGPAMTPEVERERAWRLSSSSSASPSSPRGQERRERCPPYSPPREACDSEPPPPPPAAPHAVKVPTLWRGPAEASQHRVLRKSGLPGGDRELQTHAFSRAPQLSPLQDPARWQRHRGEPRLLSVAASAAASAFPSVPYAPRRPTMRRVSAWMTPQPSSFFVVALVVLFCVRLRRRRREHARLLARRSRSRRYL